MAREKNMEDDESLLMPGADIPINLQKRKQ